MTSNTSVRKILMMTKYCHNFKILMRQNLLKKDDEQGSAILLFIFILGIVSAIALPSFLNQATKARQSEGKTFVGSMNRGQQAYHLENNAFTDSLEKLDLGIRSETESYSYSIRLGNQAAFNYGTSKRENLKSYVGGVFVVPSPNSPKETFTQAILCETDIPTNTPPSPPTNENGVLTCAAGTRQL
jgi:type IV pilus assembly protein PilA